MKTAMTIALVLGLLAGIGQAQVNEVAPADESDRPAQSGSRHLGDFLYSFDVETITGDVRLLGLEFDGEDWWFTGANDMINAALYQVSYDGSLINTFLTGHTGWGWRDLAFDGEFLYGSDSSVIDQISRATGMGTGVTIPVPISPARALAYDPATDSFWTASWSSDIFNVQRDGSYVSYPSILGGVYGMAWDDYDPAHPMLWIWSQDGNGTMASQFDPLTGTFTGLTFDGYNSGYDSAGGSCILVDPYYGWVLAGLHQSSPDMVCAYFLGYSSVVSSIVSASGEWAATQGAGGRKVVRDSSGFYHAVYEANTGPFPNMPVVEYCQSLDTAGTAWTAPLQISGLPPLVGEDPAMAIDPGDNLHVVWHDDDLNQQSEIWYRKYDAATNAWLSPVMISVTANNDSIEPSIDCDGLGVIHVAWQETYYSPAGQSEIFYSASSDGGTSFAAPVLVSTLDAGESERPCVASPFDWSAGSAHVVWDEARSAAGFHVYHRATWDNGASWTSEAVVSQLAPGNPETGLFPCLVVDGYDDPHVVYSHGHPEGGVFYNRSYDGGLTFGNRTAVAVTAEAFPEPTMAMDGDGILRLLWNDDVCPVRADDRQIIYASYLNPDLGSWTAPTSFKVQDLDYTNPSTLYRNNPGRGGFALWTFGESAPAPASVLAGALPPAVLTLGNTPASGQRGTFVNWTATATNHTASSRIVDVWLEVTAPFSYTMLFRRIAVPPGTRSGTMRVFIPPGVPVGTYDISVVIGQMGNEDWDRDCFSIQVF